MIEYYNSLPDHIKFILIYWIPIYLLCSFLWGCFAMREQIRLYGKSWWRVPLVGILNFLFCPICLIIAKAKGKI